MLNKYQFAFSEMINMIKNSKAIDLHTHLTVNLLYNMTIKLLKYANNNIEYSIKTCVKLCYWKNSIKINYH